MCVVSTGHFTETNIPGVYPAQPKRWTDDTSATTSPAPVYGNPGQEGCP